MKFKLWSQRSSEAKETLQPDLGMRTWDDLSSQEKENIWKYMREFFFDENQKSSYAPGGFRTKFFKFLDTGISKEVLHRRIIFAIYNMNKQYKAPNYTPNFLDAKGLQSACYDFIEIFMQQRGDVVLELLSFYCKAVISEKKPQDYPFEQGDTSDEDYSKAKDLWLNKDFYIFADHLNDLLLQYGINVYLSKSGFLPRQDERIIDEIYVPVLQALSHTQWNAVNGLLADAFSEYQKNNKQGYSNCVTNTIAAIEAFLQIKIHGRIGKGTLGNLVKEAQKKEIIPKDVFSNSIFKNITSILAQERMATGIAHPKEEYANEKNILVPEN
ncbi:MAG: hypothetical protein ACOCXQ_02905 [Patescibacteria group bacterium]